MGSGIFGVWVDDEEDMLREWEEVWGRAGKEAEMRAE